MQRSFHTLFALTLLLVASCTKQESRSVTGTPDAPQPDTVMASAPALVWPDTLTLGGKRCIVTLHRQPDKKQPTVTDENGTEFYDNQVEVRIETGAAAPIERTFTRRDFEPYLSAAERRNSVLQGMAIDHGKCTPQQLVLAAQVGEPGADGEGPAFHIAVPLAGGGVRITPDHAAGGPLDDLSDEEMP